MPEFLLLLSALRKVRVREDLQQRQGEERIGGYLFPVAGGGIGVRRLRQSRVGSG